MLNNKSGIYLVNYGSTASQILDVLEVSTNSQMPRVIDNLQTLKDVQLLERLPLKQITFRSS